MNSFLMVMIIVGGIMQPQRIDLLAMQGDCMTEIRVVQAINRANQAAGRDVQYVFECVNR